MENNKSFYPNQIQVRILDIADRENIRVQVYERGTGRVGCNTEHENMDMLSSETSTNATMSNRAGTNCSTAAISTAFELGLVGRKVTIHTSNGPLEVEINEDGSVQMAGAGKEASSVFVSKKVLEYLNKAN